MIHGINTYKLILNRDSKKAEFHLSANDSNHAQAQAADICRSVAADKFNLSYETIEEDVISNLYKKLAFNDFEHNSCFTWIGPTCNNNPCFYIFGKRVFVKRSIIKYLDIPEDSTVKVVCNNKYCVNPYHFIYLPEKNSKLTGGELKLLVAYRGQGTGVSQIAQALNVHRSTIYRKLKNERVSVGSADHRNGSRK